MRHVDDAHHAEGDGEPDGGEKQHRAQRQPVPDVLRRVPETEDLLDLALRAGGGIVKCALARIRRCRQDRPGLLVAARLDHVDGGDLVRLRRIGTEDRRGARLAQQRRDAGIRFRRQRLVYRLDGFRVARLEDLLGRAPAPVGVLRHQGQLAERRANGASQAVVDADALHVAPAGLAGRLAGNRIDELVAAALFPDDEDDAIGLARHQVIGAERLKSRHSGLVARRRDRRDLRLGVVVAPLGEFVDEGAQVAGFLRVARAMNERQRDEGKSQGEKDGSQTGHGGAAFVESKWERIEKTEIRLQCASACSRGGAEEKPAPPNGSALGATYSPLPPHLPVATLKLPQDIGARQSEIRSLESGR